MTPELSGIPGLLLAVTLHWTVPTHRESGALYVPREARGAELLGNRREELGGHGQIVQAASRQVVLFLNCFQAFA